MDSKKNPGRRNKYYTHVLPRFGEITEWLRKGATDKEIIKNLGVQKSAFYDYMTKHAELSELFQKERTSCVEAIKAALFNRACGYDYTETKTTVFKKDGAEDATKTETIVKHLPPDPASAMILLKHWARGEGWTNDPAVLALRREELELKKQELEKNNW